MGHGLAQVFAEAGHPVAVYDPHRPALVSLHERIAANLRELDRPEEAIERVQGEPDLEAAVAGAAFVFEAAPEDLVLKRELLGRAVQAADEGALVATNTSSIPIGSLAEGSPRPEAVIGAHWWNPPYLVPLVEVIPTRYTPLSAVQATVSFLRSVGKEPVIVKKDVPGFVGNRLQHALWREAFALVQEGICDAETVDLVVKNSFGLRLPVLGPMENADLVGLDLTLAIHEQILPHIDRTPGPLPVLRDKVERGELGMKTGSGFRSWQPGQQDETRRRLIAHLLEAMRAREGAPDGAH